MMFPKLYFKFFTRREFRLVSRRGCRWLLNYANYVDRKLILKKPYENKQIAHLQSLICRYGCNVLIDVGANFGLYSVILLDRCPQLNKAFSIEPQGRNFQQLNANLLLNGLSSRVETLPFGASSSTGDMSFLENVENSTGTSRIADTAPTSTKYHRFVRKTIQVKPLDQLVTLDDDSCCVIKMDVEGHELDVLRGAKTVMGNYPCLLQIEILEDADSKLREIEQTLGITSLGSIEHDYYFVNALMLAKMNSEVNAEQPCAAQRQHFIPL